MKRSEKGLAYISLYVDDNWLVGHTAEIKKVIEQLRENDLVLKIEDNLKDYLSCEIKFSDNKKSVSLGQPHLIAKLDKSFVDWVKDMRSYTTPGTPG